MAGLWQARAALAMRRVEYTGIATFKVRPEGIIVMDLLLVYRETVRVEKSTATPWATYAACEQRNPSNPVFVDFAYSASRISEDHRRNLLDL